MWQTFIDPPIDIHEPPMKNADGTFPLQPTPNWTLGQEMVWERSTVRRLAEAIGRDYDDVDEFIMRRWKP